MFELIFKYHERLEDGSYDKEKVSELRKKVGKIGDEISHEKLAGTIMAQLARRDVWVLDVDIFEYKKTKVSFRETKGGLVINNKKYLLDDCGHLAVQEVPEPVTQAPSLYDPGNQLSTVTEASAKGAKNVNLADLQLLKKKPIRYEVFQPDPIFVDMSKIGHLAFTRGKRYPIYSEKPAGSLEMGMNYVTIDDKNQKQVLNDKHFVVVPNLIGGDLFNSLHKPEDISLSYGDDGGFGSMPQIR